MTRLRSLLFWIHFVTGAVAGLIIAFLCVTGTLLAFEKDLIAWAERDARRVDPPALDPAPLPLATLQQRFAVAAPDARPTQFIISRDPAAAVGFVVGRSETYWVNPYTAEVTPPPATRTAAFLRGTVVWHRYLGFTSGEARDRGKLVTGIANLAFLLLAVTGLILWCPRQWSWRALRPNLWFRQNLPPRARDLNWHQVVGFWCAPVFIALTLTALPISYRWVATSFYTLTGTPLPASGPESSGAPPPVATVPAAPADSAPVAPDLLLATARATLPAWQTLTYHPAARPDAPARVVVKEAGAWPRVATTTFQFDPHRGDLLARDGYDQLSPARKLRLWSRYLHTGEALGRPAQAIAGLASLGGFALVLTGFALAYRRLFGKSSRDKTSTSSEKSSGV